MANINLGDVHGIPIVDFGSFLDGSSKQDVADAMLRSFKDVGFLYLVNHGLPKEKTDEMFAWSKKFFAQPVETKMLAPHPHLAPITEVGYSAPGMEKVSQHVYDSGKLAQIREKAPDVKESFECGRGDNGDMPNIWLPDGVLPGFKEACERYFWACYDVELNILRALALGFHLPEDFFVKTHTAPDNQLRLLHYPSVPVDKLDREEVARIGAHSDFGTMTLLVQDSVGGLEVENPHKPGQFSSATPVEGAIVINAGDFLMRWSNDTIKSTIHRVRSPPNRVTKDGMTPERYSIPYFCAADYTRVVECLPGTYSAEKPKKYEPISSKQYIMQRLAVNY